MFNFFKCKHPADWLIVEKNQTVKPYDEDFEDVTIHLRCVKCSEKINISYAKMIGGVDAFIERGRKKYA
jgi:hypothetical protein